MKWIISEFEFNLKRDKLGNQKISESNLQNKLSGSVFSYLFSNDILTKFESITKPMRTSVF